MHPLALCRRLGFGAEQYPERRNTYPAFPQSVVSRRRQQLRNCGAAAVYVSRVHHAEVTDNSTPEYTYLGQLISPKDITVKEINARIATGWKKFWSLKEIMKSQDLGIALKRKTFNTCILPCLTYGCETWALTNSLRDKLAKCQRAMERSIVGTKRRDRVRNTDIRMKTKLTDILLRVDQQKWRWTGHMMRDKHGKWCKAVSEWYPRDGKRSRGRQCIRWEDDIKIL
ncbi:unnamed protein product [Euphydryas editha]|uniref:Endonuclease-reverse transcriptase n=1 Tax=Euphydryas editha TaxID=104508 RepID=A0AAU9U6B3_EUPED|nr:unnamed protein product [Euphydryas editha]